MTGSGYIESLRCRIGTDLLLCPAVAAVIPDQFGKILLQEKSSKEGWSLPAGAIEPGETPVEALLREVREETGLEVRPTQMLGAFGGRAFRYTYPNGDTVEYTVVLYLCSIVRSLDQELDEETQSLRYFSEEDMPSLALPYPTDLLFSHSPDTQPNPRQD